MRRHLRFKRSGHLRWRVRRWPFLPPHLSECLTSWGETHYRPFPWRRGKEPFHLLLAEMLLRRTSAAHAIRVWERLVQRYPSAAALAEASIPELEAILKPAGLAHRRALALRQIARYLVQHWGGLVPAAPQDLMAVPRVGRYAAHAVASFAYGLPFAVADANVVRVLGRFTGRPMPQEGYRVPKWVWRAVERYGGGAPFNYALLDLGALNCGRKPRCSQCPLRSGCAEAN
jgi:A/G-specific adenine glycosylase